MPARSEWTWTEAFGYLEADPTRVHSRDWAAAWQETEARIEQAIPRKRLEEADARLAATTISPPEQILMYGSGWGALERRRRMVAGEADRIPIELSFPACAIGEDEAPWKTLLETGELPARCPADEPGALMTQPEWTPLIEASVGKASGDHWLAWWHLGNARMEARDIAGAEQAWRRSMEHCATGWALRNLAVAAERSGEPEEALALRLQAWNTGPQIPALAIECAQAMVALQRFTHLLVFARDLPDSVRSHERLLLLWAKAALETGETDGVERLFQHEFATIREGEVALTDLWFAYHERRTAAAEGVAIDDTLRRRMRREYPPPRSIDFRMATPAAVDDNDNGDE